MEEEHRAQISEKFGNQYDEKIVVLNVRDDYRSANDPKLELILRKRINSVLGIRI